MGLYSIFFVTFLRPSNSDARLKKLKSKRGVMDGWVEGVEKKCFERVGSKGGGILKGEGEWA